MRPRYGTESIVLARLPLAEASALLYLLTPEFGLVKARAQGVRKSGAKLAAGVQTLTELDAILVRGKEGWRLSGAILARNRFTELLPDARVRAGRIARLILRLVRGESADPELFHTYRAYLDALPGLSAEDADAAECIAALSILRTLGLDAGAFPDGPTTYDKESISSAREERTSLVIRINRGIKASGL